MKITESLLRQIIKEEIEKSLSENQDSSGETPQVKFKSDVQGVLAKGQTSSQQTAAKKIDSNAEVADLLAAKYQEFASKNKNLNPASIMAALKAKMTQMAQAAKSESESK
ncbi:hypothetical protein EBS02_11045 [bacterium]|nr:hypothetical protein [bacterium]